MKITECKGPGKVLVTSGTALREEVSISKTPKTHTTRSAFEARVRNSLLPSLSLYLSSTLLRSMHLPYPLTLCTPAISFY